MGYPIPPCINKKKRKFWRNSHLELWPSWALAERQCCLLCFRTERILLTVSSRSAQAYSGCAPRQQISKHYYCSRFGVKQSFSRAVHSSASPNLFRHVFTPDCIGARPPLSSANAQDENTACRQMNFTRLFLPWPVTYIVSCVASDLTALLPKHFVCPRSAVDSAPDF